MTPLMIAAIVEKIIIYGPNAVVAIAAAFEKGKPTVAEIRALEIVKDPEEYFDA
jgi:hypothetical protein